MSETTKDRLIRAMNRAGFRTYGELGVEIGITTQAVSEIINGRTTGATARYAVAKAVGGKVADFWPEAEAA